MNEENNIISVNKEVNVIEYDIENIKNLIYTIREKQVMLDSDVAILYHYETKRINETVRRNKERFPINFCFQLTEDETENYGGRRTLPYVFTEQGIAMLSGLLKNEIAIQVSINIMNAFVEMRKLLVTMDKYLKDYQMSSINCWSKIECYQTTKRILKRYLMSYKKTKKKNLVKKYFLMDKFMIVIV